MVESSELLAYAMLIFLDLMIPGPGLTTVLLRTLNDGPLGGWVSLFGLMMGDVILITVAAFGLGLLAQRYSEALLVLKWGAIIYLLYLAWCYWRRAPVSLASDNKPLFRKRSAFAAGLAMSVGNPKALTLYLVLLPAAISLENMSLTSWGLQLVPVTLAIMLLFGGACILFAAWVRQLWQSAEAQRRVYRSAAGAMVSVAVWLAS